MEPSRRGNSRRTGAFSVLVSHCVVVVVVGAAAVLPSEANKGPPPLPMSINVTILCSPGRSTD